MPQHEAIARQREAGNGCAAGRQWRRCSFLDPLARQLARLRAYALLTYPFACVPFLFLFFQHHGMDAGQYGEIVGAYYLAMFVAEVPTGMLADRFGYKPMLVAGPLLLATGFLSLLVWPTYGGFLLGEVLLGLGHAVLSGPPAALLYESLREHDQEWRFLRTESGIGARRMLGTGAAFLLGGLLVRFGNANGDAWALPIVATAMLCLGAAAIAVFLRSPPHQGRLRLPAFARAVAQEVRRPAVLWLLGYWIVLFALLRFPFHAYQPWLREAGAAEPILLDPLFVGVLFAAMNLFAAPFSACLPWLVERVGRRALFWGMPIVLCASLGVMAWERYSAADGDPSRSLAWLGVAMLFVQQVPFGLHQALLSDFVNHRIGSATRTTVLSVLSLGARAVYAAINVALFHVHADSGLGQALSVAAVVGLAAAMLALLLRPRNLLDAPAGRV